MIDVAADYPWCKVVISTRQEWLFLWSSKMGAQESSRLDELRPWLYVTEADRDERAARPQGPPVVMMEPYAKEQASEVYRRYQTAAGEPTIEGGAALPASTTSWDDLPEETRELLANPLNLHLFMEAFNAYFAARREGLRPTAGYTTDGRRFLADIEGLLAELGIERDSLVRDR